MTIFIPPQQKSTTHYVRWTTITAFVICMLWLASYFFQEYQQIQHNRVAALKAINDIEEFNLKIEQHNAKADEHNSKIKEVEKEIKQSKKKVIIREKRIIDTDEPTGGGEKIAIPVEPPPPKLPPPIEKQSKIEIDAGLVKVAMSNEASWMAIFKIVFTVLATFFGIKLINFGFRKLENEPKPA